MPRRPLRASAAAAYPESRPPGAPLEPRHLWRRGALGRAPCALRPCALRPAPLFALRRSTWPRVWPAPSPPSYGERKRPPPPPVRPPPRPPFPSTTVSVSILLSPQPPSLLLPHCTLSTRPSRRPPLRIFFLWASPLLSLSILVYSPHTPAPSFPPGAHPGAGTDSQAAPEARGQSPEASPRQDRAHTTQRCCLAAFIPSPLSSLSVIPLRHPPGQTPLLSGPLPARPPY